MNHFTLADGVTVLLSALAGYFVPDVWEAFRRRLTERRKRLGGQLSPRVNPSRERCAACGEDPHGDCWLPPHQVRYDASSSDLTITCGRCGYSWRKKPARIPEASGPERFSFERVRALQAELRAEIAAIKCQRAPSALSPPPAVAPTEDPGA